MAMQQESIKAAGDTVSIMTVVGTLAEILPAIAALLTIIWTGFRIFETRTVRGWFKKEPYKDE
jgi:hypothetical protein